MALRTAMLYCLEFWASKKHHIQKMCVTEMRTFRRMIGNTIKGRIKMKME